MATKSPKWLPQSLKLGKIHQYLLWNTNKAVAFIDCVLFIVYIPVAIIVTDFKTEISKTFAKTPKWLLQYLQIMYILL